MDRACCRRHGEEVIPTARRRGAAVRVTYHTSNGRERATGVYVAARFDWPLGCLTISAA